MSKLNYDYTEDDENWDDFDDVESSEDPNEYDDVHQYRREMKKIKRDKSIKYSRLSARKNTSN